MCPGVILGHMRSPEYFFMSDTRWNNWVTIEISDYTDVIIAGTQVGAHGIYPRTHVDAKYPGFFDACAALSKCGCDKTLTTDVLKLCILQSEGLALDKFLIHSQLLNKIEIAVAIGLENEDVLASLKTNLASSPIEPPDDIGDVATP